ncbi:roadblock/LC7 domain-containing protein [Streptomyces sp. RKND-216]|uniref:roadblock/LC7 domain-containing protein n=1 Tax=Streptomyces sp. RKND-216 TaxID=2562581 RepID=UPI00109DD8BD|nr:roadblock/LC7 domain-containing protein [Streptomyces sp. RKND-216]THA23632.1 roadblock/LC7 domain-containing protein [Streptomyces sp. RKND-216]
MTDNRDAWMLRQVLDQPGVLDAILVSADGLLRAFSPGLDRDDAETVAAALAGVQATSRATARFCRAKEDSWEQSLVQFGGGFVLTVRAGEGMFMSVATGADADIEAVAYRMHQVVGQMGRELVSPPRQSVGSPR